jgi:poly[(R)-3-hydroxyalkanoate] polymerase subunit PhaC
MPTKPQAPTSATKAAKPTRKRPSATAAPAADAHVAPSAGFGEDPPILGANPFVGLNRRQIGAALGRLLQRVVVEPGVAIASGVEAAGQLVKVAVGRSEVGPGPGDKRFVDSVWADHPLYRRLLQTYFVQCRAISRLVDEVELDHKSRERARFAVSLLTEAAAPTNYLVTNPTALAKAVETRGQSLMNGLRHFTHDLRHNGGMPSMVDTRPFKVGVNIAATPGQVVHRSEVFELIQYAPSTDQVYERPFVAIPPQINKYYFTDLAPGRSMVEYAVVAGIPYFAVSWRNPTAAQRDWNLETYVSACKEAIEVACDISGAENANVIGICAGGITLSCLLGHLAATGNPLVHSATLMVAGLDTEQESMVGMLSSKATLNAARSRSQRKGVLDGDELGKVFAWLRPNDLVWNYWVNNYLLGENPPAFDILFWNSDTTRLPAGLHSDFLELFSSNGLARPGTMKILGTPVDLGAVKTDTYIVAGATDHIIPWAGAYQSTQMFGGATEYVLSNSGHIQAIVCPPGNKKSSYLTRPGPPPPDAMQWRAEATPNPGTWWDHWLVWLTERSGDKRAAPTELGNDRHPPLEAAPGRYVLQK